MTGFAQSAGKTPPVFPGSAQDEQEAAQFRDEGAAQDVKAYATKASIEEVFRYYRSQLGGKLQGENAVPDPRGMAPGATSEAQYFVTYYDAPVGARKRLLSANRKPDADGQWIRSAGFSWIVKTSPQTVTSYSIQIEDRSLSQDSKSYSPKTVIAIQQQTVNLPGSSSRAAAAAGGPVSPTRKAGAAAAKPPAESELGAPIYPGSFFDAQTTAALAKGARVQGVFLTTDPPAKVAEFYRAKLAIQPVRDDDEHYMVVLKGTMPLPEKGIEIQVNRLFDQKYRTVITFACWK
jgi:hypothetical protein